MRNKYWSKTAQNLSPYVPGEQPHQQNLIKLNTNENPYPPSPKVLQALKDCADEKLRLYPDPDAEQLKQALADYFQLDSKQVFVGNGSDEVLAHTFVALLQQEKPILLPEISYSFYPVYCQLFAVRARAIPLNKHYEIDLAAYQQENGGIIFPNPNAPTGHCVSLQAIEKLLQHNRHSVVVVDEAYIDFGGRSAAALVNLYPNLLVVQTFSKSRSLAGLRVGFALGHQDLIEALERVKNSFNSYPLDRFAISGAVAALADQAYFEQCCQKIISSRAYVTAQMTRLGFEILPSWANFIFARHPQHDAEDLASQLRAAHIIVRHFKQENIDQFLRISIGTQQECELLIKRLQEILLS